MSGVRIRNGRENTKIVPDVERVFEGTFIKDIVAGIIVAIIALPLSIALALASPA